MAYRLRLVQAPEDRGPLLSSAQIRLARVLGRLYIAFNGLMERIRIQWSVAPDRFEPGSVLVGLIRQQRGLVIWLALLAVVGAIADSLAPRLVEYLRTWPPTRSWSLLHWPAPTEMTVQAVLGVSATATGTILGIVLSITLIVFQTTADRYRGGRIMPFLLRERVTSVVVQLLALGFAYSIWLLFLYRTVMVGQLPYVSTVLALILSTAGILALVTYRGHALLGYLPSSITTELLQEIVKHLRRVQSDRSRPSVELFANNIAEQDLSTLADLIWRLRTDQDAHGVERVIRALDGFLEYYIRTKRLIPENSRWWARRRVRADSPLVRMTERLAAEGLMDPTSEEPDRVWLERQSLALVRDADQLEDPVLRDAEARLLFRQLQFAFYGQETDTFFTILSDLEEIADARVATSDRLSSEQWFQIPWLLIELVAKGMGFNAQRVVESEPWDARRKRSALPWLESQEAKSLGVKIRSEIAIAGHVVTPRHAMKSEVQRALDTTKRELDAKLLRSAFGGIRERLATAVQHNPGVAGVAAKQALRALLRASHQGISPEIPPDLPSLLAKAYVSESDATILTDLREDSALLARQLAERRDWASCWTALQAAVFLGATAEQTEPDNAIRLGLTFDMLMTLALIHAWAEFYGEPATMRLSRYIDTPWKNLDALGNLVNDDAFSTTRLLSFASGVKYQQWFQSLLLAVHTLEPRYEYVGSHSLPIEVGKKHLSSLFSNWHDFHGYDECLQHLVKSTLTLREIERRRLVEAIEAVARVKGTANS